VVVVPLLTYNCRALIFACGVEIVAGNILVLLLLLLLEICLDLFNVFVDNEDD